MSTSTAAGAEPPARPPPPPPRARDGGHCGVRAGSEYDGKRRWHGGLWRRRCHQLVRAAPTCRLPPRIITQDAARTRQRARASHAANVRGAGITRPQNLALGSRLTSAVALLPYHAWWSTCLLCVRPRGVPSFSSTLASCGHMCAAVARRSLGGAALIPTVHLPRPAPRVRSVSKADDATLAKVVHVSRRVAGTAMRRGRGGASARVSRRPYQQHTHNETGSSRALACPGC